jgi:tetratricopeptide (TPR) repeat protein
MKFEATTMKRTLDTSAFVALPLLFGTNRKIEEETAGKWYDLARKTKDTEKKLEEKLKEQKAARTTPITTIFPSIIALKLPESEKYYKQVFEEALEVARSMSDEEGRSDALRYIALDLARAGEPYKQVFEEALEVARSMSDEHDHQMALAKVALDLAKAGEPYKQVFEEALEVARSIGGWGNHFDSLPNTLRYAASELAEAGEFEEALKVARSISDGFSCSWALEKVAFELAKAGELEGSYVTSELAEAGKFEEALEVARSISGGGLCSEALVKVASELAKAGEPYKQVFEEVLGVARSIISESDRSWALAKVALDLAKAGESYKQVFEEALEVARSISNESDRSWALVKVASELAKAGEPYKHIFEEALGVARNCSGALGKAAPELAKAGELEDALEVARSIGDEVMRSWVLATVASDLVETGEFEEALGVARSISNELYRSWALGKAALELAKMEEQIKPIKSAEAVIETAKEFGCDISSAFGLLEEANSAFNTGNYEEAIEYTKLVEEDAKGIIEESRPETTLTFPEETFQPDVWKKIDVTITNIGSMHAKDISIEPSGDIEFRRIPTIPQLNINETETITIAIKPTVMGDVPIDIALTYKDALDRDYTSSEEVWVLVADSTPAPEQTPRPTAFTTLRTVWDPSNKDFVWDAEKPDEYGELPRIKEWIRNKNPNIYWFLLKIANHTDHPINEWNVTLYTERALTITEAHIDEKQVRIVKNDFDTDSNRNVCVVSIPPELGVSIPANGGRRSMYFKMDIRCEDALKMEFGVSGVVKLGMSPQIEVPIREKRFTYACKFGDFRNMYCGSIDALASQITENLQNSYNPEIVQNFTNSFRLIRDFEKYCNDRYAESEILIEKLEVIHSSLKAAKPITKEEILPLVEENLVALRLMSGVEAQQKRGMRMCGRLVELLHIATFKIRWGAASGEDGAMMS